MISFLISGLLILISAVQAWAFDASQARTVLNTLASDKFQGRQSGHPGAEDAEYFLAGKLSEYGVYQGGGGSYFQPYPLLVTQEKKASLTVLDGPLGRVQFKLGADFTLLTHSGSGSVTAPVVLVGHGYVRPDKDRDDYAGADVKGKIVVIIRGYPEGPWDFSEDFERRHTMHWAKERGAAAILYYQDGRVINGAAIPADIYDPSMPLLFVGDRALNLLLDDTGYTLGTYQEKIKYGPLPLETHKRMAINTRVERLHSDADRNVLGYIYGTDPVLRNEIIVVGGHLDHIGVNAEGVVYNGAEDNASGSAVVSELARSLSEHPLKRSVLIAHFGGEEDGLLGSNYFVEHPTVPLENVVCMVNFDMSGEGGKQVVMGGGDLLGDAWNDFVASLDSASRARTTFYREDGHGASDNLSFLKGGVPAIAFWSRGDHLYYHHYSDDASWVQDSVIQMVGSSGENFIRFIGNHDGKLASHADSLAMMADFQEVVDFRGNMLDQQASVPDVGVPSAEWVAPVASLPTVELLRRVSEFRYACENHDVTAGSMKDALEAGDRLKKGVFLGVSEDALSSRRPAEVATLTREGVQLVRLTSEVSGEHSAPKDVLEEARKDGAFAVIPIDVNAPSRVEMWKSKAIVLGSLNDFAAFPGSVRDGLLNSDAMIVLEVTSIPTGDQLAVIYPVRTRRVHLNAGTAPQASRSAEQKATVRAMYKAGMSRSDILSLTGGNLRRYLGM